MEGKNYNLPSEAKSDSIELTPELEERMRRLANLIIDRTLEDAKNRKLPPIKQSYTIR